MSVVEKWSLDFDGRYPIYEQIVAQMSRSLVKGDIKPGDRIPSIRDMAMSLKVNTNTIQRAYQEMERRQIIFSQRGTGYFVMEQAGMVDRLKQEMVGSSLNQFIHEMKSLGFGNQQILEKVEHYLEKGGK